MAEVAARHRSAEGVHLVVVFIFFNTLTFSGKLKRRPDRFGKTLLRNRGGIPWKGPLLSAVGERHGLKILFMALQRSMDQSKLVTIHLNACVF